MSSKLSAIHYKIKNISPSKPPCPPGKQTASVRQAQSYPPNVGIHSNLPAKHRNSSRPIQLYRPAAVIAIFSFSMQSQNGHKPLHGFNFLLRSELSFWDTICREKMPASKFLVQTDADVFNEVVHASSLPCFTTDYGQLQGGYPNRVNIPLTDAEADVIFYLASRNTDK